MTRKEIIEHMLKMAENISMDSITLYVMTNRDLEVVAAAAALLKEQEPRVMQISEIMEIYKADPSHVWPYNTPPYLYVQEHPHVRNSSESWAAWREIRDIIEGELFGHTAQSYGKTWRCWTSRPTNAQREATPWENTPAIMRE